MIHQSVYILVRLNAFINGVSRPVEFAVFLLSFSKRFSKYERGTCSKKSINGCQIKIDDDLNDDQKNVVK